MKLARIVHHGQETAGVVDGGTVRPLDWGFRDAVVLAAAGRTDLLSVKAGPPVPLDLVTLLAPVVPGGRVFCAGINYAEHQRESADVFVQELPKSPILFMKSEAAIAPPYADLVLPTGTSRQFDWEGELGVVIGAPLRSTDSDDVLSAVAGYTVANDISARDLQVEHVQWCLGKNVERATPIGPWLVTPEELGAEPDFEIVVHVNSVIKQRGRTSDMIFNVPTLIRAMARVAMLRPGDVILTGTPSGVGFKRTPPEFLHSGDVVDVEITGVGSIRNRIVT